MSWMAAQVTPVMVGSELVEGVQLELPGLDAGQWPPRLIQ